METAVSIRLNAPLDYSFLRQAFGVRTGEPFLTPESGIPSNLTCLVILDCEVWKNRTIRGFAATRTCLGINQIELQTPQDSEVIVDLRSIGALNQQTHIAKIQTNERSAQEFTLSLTNISPKKASTEKPCAARVVERKTIKFKLRMGPAFISRYCKDEVEKQTTILCLECEIFGGQVFPELLDFFSKQILYGENDVSFTGPSKGEAHLFIRLRGATKSRFALGTLQLAKVPQEGCVLSFDRKPDRVDELLHCFVNTPNDVGFIGSGADVRPGLAVKELAQLHDSRAFDALMKIIETDGLDWLIRHEAIDCLVLKRERRVIPLLIRIVENHGEDPEVRRRAAWAIAGQFKDSLGVRAIRNALKSEESSRSRYSFIMCLKDGGWWHDRR